MGDILIILGAVLALIVFILIMIGGVMFIASLFGGVVDVLTGPARQRRETAHAALTTEITLMQEQVEQARALSAHMNPPSPLAPLSQREREIAARRH